MPRYRAVRAFHVFDLAAKTISPRADLEYALAYELTGVEADSPGHACEIAFAHSNRDGRRPSGYDGPSLSVGDLVEVEGDAGTLAVYRVAIVGFQRIDAPDELGDLRTARRRQPPEGGWRAPRLDLEHSRLEPGTSWAVWLAFADQVNLKRRG